MPAMLFEDEERMWIDNSIPAEDLKTFLKPYPADLVYAYPVSTKINNVRNNSPDLIQEVPNHNPEQGKLF